MGIVIEVYNNGDFVHVVIRRNRTEIEIYKDGEQPYYVKDTAQKYGKLINKGESVLLDEIMEKIKTLAEKIEAYSDSLC